MSTTNEDKHKNCVSKEQFINLQELHDAQKKIIAKLMQENQELKSKLNE